MSMSATLLTSSLSALCWILHAGWLVRKHSNTLSLQNMRLNDHLAAHRISNGIQRWILHSAVEGSTYKTHRIPKLITWSRSQRTTRASSSLRLSRITWRPSPFASPHNLAKRTLLMNLKSTARFKWLQPGNTNELMAASSALPLPPKPTTQVHRVKSV